MKPRRIFILRHGQSVGNVDKTIYAKIPDYALSLTDLGKQQAENVGKELHKIIGRENIQFYVSPYWRTRQTYLGLIKAFSNEKDFAYTYYEDPRLREQEWGQDMESREGFKDKVEEYRDNYGHFYYRFGSGESCADVFDRVSDFMGTLFRDFEKNDFAENVIIVTHGMTMRLFLMRWFHASVETFESWRNPKNCEYFLLEREDVKDKYTLSTPLRKHEIKHPYQFDWDGKAPKEDNLIYKQ